MATKLSQNVAYGLSEPLINVFPTPIIAARAPTTADKAQLGTIWINSSANAAWVLTSVVSNVSTWVDVSGGTGTFTSLTVNPGNITATAGNIVATAGSISAGTTVTATTSISAGTTITAGTGFTATTGNIVATTGNVNVTAGNITVTAGSITATVGEIAAGGVVEGQSIIATGDAGGTASTTTMSGVVSASLSTGTLSVKSESTNNGNNTGFLKFYVGTTAVYVPYFATIAP